MSRLACAVVALCLIAPSLMGCGESGGQYPPQRLSEWGLFEDGARQIPAEGVIPYEIISPLFSDYASKHRFIRLPEGGRIEYRGFGSWVFPVGTVVAKSFGFVPDVRQPGVGERLLETRLLVLEDDGQWHPYVYWWDETMTDATLHPEGRRVPVELTLADGSMRSFDYRIPNTVQCANCHGGAGAIDLIGPRSEQIDMDHDYGSGPVNQIDHMVSLGWFEGTVPPYALRTRLEDPFGTGPLDARARAYLDANCAHCHRQSGFAQQSGLFLGAFVANQEQLGICKVPIAAGGATGGRSFDIVPGAPDESIVTFRMASEEPGIKMPELPSVLAHSEGLALITEWIAAMSPPGCASP
ncbi:MAG: hypothetical protein K8H88_20895 [Sandaracinaceae bacterium]|nr:hypothetical protein [Sandaracinaceae bacterium]